ncbi:Spb1 C-terminal domain-containing protein [Xylaria bambusicola]|uniref:Spb1 C-terminal domain-containing protein n=1 Tax=Xylaria bambusicola TaxID=326684 RepID=UPI0020079190|nr:Spb1 C-terminal domain-containing protein [Xylaria bambusicola]KAI0514442.1 Spb1 C-terminal domain-containing protein [Xylaria bambusicola]
MGFQKKTGKGRLDKYYRLAKEKGYRARAAFKLLQLNKKYDFLGSSRVVIDLCAAPGSWLQVAAEAMPKGSLIVGVDLSPIKPIPGVISFQSDITTDKCRAELRRHLKTWKADTVLHDGAPNVGTAWIQDSFNQAELTLQSLKLACEFLVEGGTFCTKVFRSAQFNQLTWIFNQLFDRVDTTKPPSSRNVSAEIFCVCRGFKAPKHLDPRFLDPKTAFADLNDTANTDEAKVYKPELKKRKRGGYEEGDYASGTLYREVLASEFVETTDPISILANTNRLILETLEPTLSLAALQKMPATTTEIRQYCSDLKVLGRSEFKKLLKWRLVAREAFGLPTKKQSQPTPSQGEGEEEADVQPMDEELKLQEDLQALKDKDVARRKREKRKQNEKKTKDIQRVQMNMMAPMDIGIESATVQPDMFQLKALEKQKVVGQIAKGRMAILTERPKKDQDSGIGSSGDTDDESDDLNDRLERELDQHWDAYQERRRNYEARIKRRKQEEDGEWEGVSADEQESSDDDMVEESDGSDDDEDDEAPQRLLTDLDGVSKDAGLSKRATKFFDQDIFKDIPGLEQSDTESLAEEDMEDALVASKTEVKPVVSEKPSTKASKHKVKEQISPTIDEEEDEDQEDDDWEKNDQRRPDGKPSIDIVTAEAMELARQLASGQKTKQDLIDENFDKYAFRDRDGLPDWFLEDEARNEKKQKPITKEAAQAIKEKMRALNARPIKKVREAQARKKFKTAQRLEKLKKKSDLLANEEGMTEKEKAESIAKLLGKAKKKAPKRSVKVVVARGANRGIQGRPKGVKGRYKIVDARMKKEMRALKRISKRK